MDGENKSSKGPKEKNSPLQGRLTRLIKRIFKRIFKKREHLFPPTLSQLEKWSLWFCYLVVFCSFIYLIKQFCSEDIFSYLTKYLDCVNLASKYLRCIVEILPRSISGTYLSLSIILVVLIIDRFLRHKINVHKARLEDISEVEALFVEADTVEHRLTKPEKRPIDWDRKKEELDKEVKRLKELGSRGWTEYQVLSLNQLLIDFLKEDELKARSRLTLAELEQYAEDSSYRYDWEQYYRWDGYLSEAIENIDKIDKDEKNAPTRDEAAETLRAELKTLLEHVADYQANWAEGSTFIRNIMTCGVVAIPILLVMGLLPNLHPSVVNDEKVLSILNWALLGISGALTAVLLNLRKSNLVEVGNTEGKKELWRAVLSVALGLVAGILGYSMIAGSILLTGGIVPNISSTLPREIGLSVVWAVASGFYFEAVFDRMLSATLGGNR
jgi:hypothetical protein